MVEEGDTAAEENRNQVDPDLIEQARVQALPGDTSAVDTDCGAAGELFGLVDGRLDAVGDEGEVLALWWPAIGHVMGEYDHRSSMG
jgi:hypothetical protein